MPTETFDLQRLLREADALKPEFFPLRAHYAASCDQHTRETYATLLAALLLSDGTISAAESRLFGMLLTALELGHIQVRLFEQAHTLSQNSLREFFRLVKTEELAQCFVLDALILCRLDGPLSEGQSKLLSELVEFLQLAEDDLPVLTFWASKVLGLPFEKELPENRLISVLAKTSSRRFPPQLMSGFNSHLVLSEIIFFVEKIYIHEGQMVSKKQKILDSNEIKDSSYVYSLIATSHVSGMIYKILFPTGGKFNEPAIVAKIVPISSACNVWLDVLEAPPKIATDSEKIL